MWEKIRIFIVNESTLMCNILACVLEDEPDIEVKGYSTNIDDALKFINDNNVDIVLVNLYIKDKGALELTKSLNETSTKTNIIVLNMLDKDSLFLPLIEAGAKGFVQINNSVSDLLNEIRMVYKDKAKLTPELTRTLMERLSELKMEGNDFAPDYFEDVHLTDREFEILEFIGMNYKNKEIASQLFIEEGTVKNHVHNILEKLNVGTRGEASRYLYFIKSR